jgi:hypothetical protein
MRRVLSAIWTCLPVALTLAAAAIMLKVAFTTWLTVQTSSRPVTMPGGVPAVLVALAAVAVAVWMARPEPTYRQARCAVALAILAVAVEVLGAWGVAASHAPAKAGVALDVASVATTAVASLLLIAAGGVRAAHASEAEPWKARWP